MSSEPETKGPWVIVPEDDDADGEEFGFVVIRDVNDDSWASWEMPTRLQAEAKRDELNKLEAIREAAPELLAACKAAVVAFPEDDGAIMDWKDDEARRVIRQIKAAIAKAEQS